MTGFDKQPENYQLPSKRTQKRKLEASGNLQKLEIMILYEHHRSRTYQTNETQ
jgi:hypothetical protein